MFAIADPKKIPTLVLVHKDDIEAELRAQVLADAEKELGYKGESFGARGVLAKTLVDLGISPLDTRSVLVYMTSKKSTWVIDPADRLAKLIWVASVVIAAFIPHFVFHASNFESEATIVITAILSGLICGLISTEGKEVRYKQYWNKVRFGNSYDSHENYVPIFALNYAVQIKRALPDATFFIHSLMLEVKEVKKPLPDPFLEVVHGGEHYFIAVWDERDYEAKN